MCAFFIPQPGGTLTLNDLRDFLLDKQIAKFKLPERLELVDDFPMSKLTTIKPPGLSNGPSHLIMASQREQNDFPERGSGE